VSDTTKEVLSLVRKVADTDSTVLITGESGTGKELIARALHYLSPVPTGCSSHQLLRHPAELLESELFGHVKGAFTGAHATRAGKIRDGPQRHDLPRRDRGDEPPPPGEAAPGAAGEVGHPSRGNRAIQVDARVITATNKDLEEEVSEGDSAPIFTSV